MIITPQQAALKAREQFEARPDLVQQPHETADGSTRWNGNS